MKRIVIVLYLCLIGLLATATFLEQAYGTSFVEKNIYHTLWFCGLWGAMAVIGCMILLRRSLWRRFPVLLLHGSLLLILVGAMVTFVYGKQGHIHLRQDATTDSFLSEDDGVPIRLPFAMRLDSFRVAYYPGTEAPADYISYSSPDQPDTPFHRGQISMNRIFASHNFRFYQSSFDEDERGSWLTVNYDPWGSKVTYAGYILLFLSMILTLCYRRGEFRRLLNHPLLKRGGLFLLLLGGIASVHAQDTPLRVLNRQQADSLATKQVIYHDRNVPFNTLARDFVQKLSGKTYYKGLTPEQVVSGWILYPESWKNEPLIRIKSNELRNTLGLKGSHARLTDLFDGPVYRLQKTWQKERNTGSKLAKAIQETDEKVGLILMLEKGTFICAITTDSLH